MKSQTIACLFFFALLALVAMVTAVDDADAETGIVQQGDGEQLSLSDILHPERRAPDEDQGEVTGRKGGRRRKGKGKRKGRRKQKQPPVYESCVHPEYGMTCTCDMRFEKFKNDPVKQWKFYLIC